MSMFGGIGNELTAKLKARKVGKVEHSGKDNQTKEMPSEVKNKDPD